MAAVNFQRLLRQLGHAGEIYAGEMHPSFRGWIQPATSLHVSERDVVLYHHGIASALAGQLMHLPCRRGVIFHNITPARFYEGTPLEDALVTGRAQLAALAEHVHLSIGVSEYNCAELREAGHRNVHTVPLFIDPERFDRDRADQAKLSELRSRSLTLLSVSRVVPHKRVDDLLSLHAEVLRIDPEAQLFIVGGYDGGSKAFKLLKRRASELSGVQFLGKLSHAELVAAYHASHVFVSMSEHEGFGVPLIEAMAAGVPVLAYAASAVPETLGGAGVAFDEKRFAFLAEVCRELKENRELRDKVIHGQLERLAQFGPDVSRPKLQQALRTIAPEEPARTKRTTKKKPHVGLIVQRYGDVGGGAEAHAKMIVERLSPQWDLTVLTSCAKDHLTWANEFPEGESKVDGTRVLRFPASRSREIHRFNQLSSGIFGVPQDRMAEEHWVAEQGPVTPKLFRHLSEQRDRYDGFVAFTYLYAPTVWGLPMVADKALLVPTAHEEPPFEFDIYSDVFERPRVLMCNTPEEAELIQRRFPRHARIRVVGVGVDAKAGKPERFAEKFGLRRPYLMYVGRLEEGKNLRFLIEHYVKLRKGFHDAPDLVLAGRGDFHLDAGGVRYLGRITEQEKWDGLAGALGVVVPSKYESLSLLALEGFAQGAPLIANAECSVLEGQARRSQAGFTFDDYESLVESVRLAGEQRDELSKRAKAFAKQHTWAKVVDAYVEEMERILSA